ncbi:MAG: DUF11 domain-containing protein, partial [Chloroflexi bacterium]|nr:DUF11 domain-containing protein [Chloroflexota bacterium]
MGDEYQIYRMFLALPGGSSAWNIMCSVVTIVATSNGQQVYYDHWEDGYETNIFTPVQTTTLTFGDGNTANGDSGHDSDTLAPGIVLSLASDDNGAGDVTDTINVNPRDPNEIRYDSRDRIVTTGGPANVVHAVWPNATTYIGGAWEIYSFQAWHNGTSYTVPVGEGSFDDFDYTWLEIQAAEDDTSVTIDNGTTTVNITLDRGDTYGSNGYINSAAASSIIINEGTAINTTKPVQAGLVTGSDDDGGGYQTRFFAMIPDVVWGTEYIAPVSSISGDADAQSQIYFFNPNDFTITVNTSDQISSTGVITLPANSARSYSDSMGHYVPPNSAIRLISSNIFWALGSFGSGRNSYDWGYSLIPVNFLTSDYYISWAPGEAGTPNDNGSPIHVTPRDGNTTFYVDYGPTDGVVDRTFTLDTLERGLVLDPDADNTGMHIWTDNKPFTAVWGETPPYATTADQYLDLGTTILPLYHGWLDPILNVEKTANTQIIPSTGGTVTFKLDIDTYHKVMDNVNITDTLPHSWTYINSSAVVTFPNGSTASMEPTINGQNLLWNLNQKINTNGNLQITFDAQFGALGASVTEDWETGAYTGGVGWTGDWTETSDDGDAANGHVQNITTGVPYDGSRHLMIRGSRSISREVDLSTFILPTLSFWRKTTNLNNPSDTFNMDISHNGGITWTRVLTFADGDNENTYVEEQIDLSNYKSLNAAIRFIGSSAGNGDYLYIDDIEIFDGATIHENVGIAVGTYSDNKFEASDNQFIYVSDLSLNKTADKDEAVIGEELVYTLAYSNSGSITTTNTFIRDVVPVNTTFSSVSTGGAYITASNTVSWGPLTIAPESDGTAIFTVTVDNVADGTLLENSATIDSDQTAEATSNVVKATALAPVLNLSKSGPSTAATGDTITYTIAYANNGGASATGVIINDTVPVSTTYVADSLAINTGSGWTSLSDDADLDAGHYDTISKTMSVRPGLVSGNLSAGETGQIRFAVTIDATAPEGSSLSNVATVDSDQSNPAFSNLASTDISPLIIAKSGDRSIAIAGETATFSVTFENRGSVTLTNILLIDSIPDNTTLISGTVTGGGTDSTEYSTDNGQSWNSSFADPANVTDIRWKQANMVTDTQQTIQTVRFQVTLDDPLPGNTTIQNQARITSTQTTTSGWLYSNQVSVGTINLTISKIANAAFVHDGDPITYTITYGNNGSADADNAVISDTIPANTSYVAGSISGDGADDSDPTRLMWNLASIPANSGGYKASFVVTVTPDTMPGTPIYNTASLTNAYDSASSIQVQVTVAEAGVTISPNRSDNSHGQGEQVCYAHTVGNTGPLSDTMELTATHSVWTAASVSFYQDNNLNGEYDGPDTPLTDTNANTITDTGNLLPAQTIEILACFTIPTTGVADGDSDTLTVQATTYANGTYANSSQVQDSTTVWGYNSVSINSPADGLITNTASISVTGTTNPNATVVITNTATGVTYTVQADGSGNFGISITLTVGSNPLDITSTDPDDNVATANPTVILTNDDTNTSNTLSISSPSNGYVTSTLTITAIGTTDPNSTVTITNAATGATFTATADNNGFFTVTVTGLISGTNLLEATSVDLFGNSATDNVTVLVDTTPGSNSLTITSPISGTTIETPVTVSGTTNPGSTVTVTLSTSGAVYTTTADNAGNFTITGVDLATGNNTITVTSVDPSGNLLSENVIVIGVRALSIEKTAEDLNSTPLQVGDQIRYAITVTNDTTATMTGVIVTDTLPNGVSFVSATPITYTGPNPLVWNVGGLSTSATWTAVITVEVNGTADPIGGNVASVRSDQQPDPIQTDPILPP